MYINLNKWAHEKEVRAFCDKQGLRVEFEDEHRPRTNGTTIYVGNPDPTWDEDNFVKWKSSIYHEAGHNVPEMRDCFELANELNLDMSSFLGFALNLVDDYRQEHFKYDEYAGRRSIMERGRKLVVDENIAKDVYKATSGELRERVIMTMSAWDSMLREDWQPLLSGQGDKIASCFDSEQLDWLSKLNSGTYGEELNSLLTAKEEYALLKRILREVFEIDPEEEEQNSTAPSKSSTSSGGEGDGEDAQDGEGASSSDSDEGEEGDGKAQQDGKVDYGRILMHRHDEVETGESYASLTIDYSDYPKGTFSPAGMDEVEVVEYRKESSLCEGRYAGRIRADAAGSALSKRVRKLLQVYSQSHNIHGQKQGKISSKNIYRVTIKGGGEYNRRIFKKKITNNILDTSVCVLVDGSGSMMGGSKYINASTAAIHLNESIARIGVPVEVVCFSEGSEVVHGVMKQYAERVNGDDLARRFIDFGSRYMGNNSDGESILWAVNRLRRQQTKKKVMIVLSDGSPVSSKYGDAMTFTQDVVKQIENSGDIDIYGIGIQDRNVSYIYKNYTVINNSSEIEDAIFAFIRKQVITH